MVLFPYGSTLNILYIPFLIRPPAPSMTQIRTVYVKTLFGSVSKQVGFLRNRILSI